jgi:hypothetical protein
MEKKQAIFKNYKCTQLSNPVISLWLTEEFGPRVIALALTGGTNLFAEVPEARLECPGIGWYSLHGGHRLWYAPEYPPITYLPDDEPVEIQEVLHGVKVIQQPEKNTGLVKSITVTLPDDNAHVLLDHKIKNLGAHTVHLAPWTITMMRPGGTAILPLQIENEDEFGVLPNRTVNLWPYTQLNSPQLIFTDRYIFIDAKIGDEKLKIGCPNPRGWLAYSLEGCLFVKFTSFDPLGYYFDRRCSSEFYCDPAVLELEALGRRVMLEPGQSVQLKEEWKVFPGITVIPDQDAVDNIVGKLGLEN